MLKFFFKIRYKYHKLKSLLSKSDKNKAYVVSGFKRSGTSLMMMILYEIGIMPYYSWEKEFALKSEHGTNNKFYFETKHVHKGFEKSDLIKFRGQSIKIFSYGLDNIPFECDENIKMIYMSRDKKDIVNSIKSYKSNPEKIYKTFTLEKDIELIERIDNDKLSKRFNALIINYDELITNPVQELIKLREYLQIDFNINHVAKVIEPKIKHF